MKHIYNPTKAVHIQQPSAKAMGAAAASKIFMLMLLSFFLLVSEESFGQTITNISPSCVIAGQDVTFTINGDKFNTGGGNPSYIILNESSDYIIPLSISKNQIVVTIPGNRISGTSLSFKVGQPSGESTNPGTINVVQLVGIPGQTCVAGNSVTLSATGSSNGNYRWYASATGGTSIGQQSTLLLNGLQNSTTYYVSAVIGGCETARIPVQAVVGNSIIPTAVNNGRCNAGQLTISVTGAPVNTEYRWYNTPTSNSIQHTGATLTDVFDRTTTYYVSIYNATSGGCESARVPVTATIGNPPTPTITSDGDCGNGNPTITLTAHGALGSQVYRWYRDASGGTPIKTGNTLSIRRNSESGYYYVAVYDANGNCESSARAIINITNEAPAAPQATNGVRCGEGEVVLSASGALGGETYRWYTTQSGGSYLSQGLSFTTPTIQAGTSINYYVSKVNIGTGCDGERVLITATANPIVSTAIEGNIVGLANPEVNKRADYTYEINIPDNEIIGHEWLIYYNNTPEPLRVVGGKTYTIESVPAEMERVAVVLQLAPGICYTAASIDGKIAIDDLPITPLPVELMFFKAQAQTKGVNLTWATASELENKGFEVQVSSNGRDFKAIGFVESKVGTTSLRQDYSFLDTKAVSGTRYYRLKQVDFDGTTSFSPIRAVALDAGNSTVSAYPNPFDDAVIVTLNGTEARNVQVVLMDAMGKVLLQRTEETSGNSITVDMRNVTTKGMYVLHVLDNNTKHTFKIMKR
ncbi:Ig-like domain-containing protein [Pontibacter amylolyticus]|uniref:T9SS type A sorting domain-containing protein n=1 Tax=Pontibacter amylolyticus TaxID=1424080 RepID=A0ABQ1W3X2_9BACT|nr:T9SS type A sorting domain-containing protein [Pontibacter amylolyticus]GGG10783.1 hypothetical protein GCM10011323_14130 [Pontibacter amylolyticus]